MASEALAFIRNLYLIERSIADKPPDLRLKVRQEKSEPILNQFHEWLLNMSTIMLKTSPTGKAISYALNQWQKLTMFLKNGLIPIDNNYLESHIRPFVIGRNNWIFSDSVAGAEASANLYTLIETAKVNGIDPYDYLNMIFKELPSRTTADALEELLPYNAKKHFELKAYQVKK